MGFKTRTKNEEGWSRGDMRWKTVPQTGGRDRKRSVADGDIHSSIFIGELISFSGRVEVSEFRRLFNLPAFPKLRYSMLIRSPNH